MTLEQILADLKSLRTKRGMSQVALCARVGVSLNAYRMWESGVSKPSPQNFQKLIEVLDIKVEEEV